MLIKDVLQTQRIGPTKSKTKSEEHPIKLSKEPNSTKKKPFVKMSGLNHYVDINPDDLYSSIKRQNS